MASKAPQRNWMLPSQHTSNLRMTRGPLVFGGWCLASACILLTMWPGNATGWKGKSFWPSFAPCDRWPYEDVANHLQSEVHLKKTTHWTTGIQTRSLVSTCHVASQPFVRIGRWRKCMLPTYTSISNNLVMETSQLVNLKVHQSTTPKSHCLHSSIAGEVKTLAKYHKIPKGSYIERLWKMRFNIESST